MVTEATYLMLRLPMNKDYYDIIFAGGGCAAWQMLYQMRQQTGFEKLRILVIEKQPEQPSKTWCFWHKNQHELQHLVEHSWQSMQFLSHRFNQSQPISPYQYSYISGENYFEYFYHTFLSANSNITLLTTTVLNITSNGINNWMIKTTEGNFTSCTVYNSIPPSIDNTRHLLLWQQFKGWHIETEKPCFNPGVMTMMDFRATMEDACSFVYILPFSSTKALVEFTVFTPNLYPEKTLENHLHQYIEQHLSTHFIVSGNETGKIPMTTFTFDSGNPATGHIYIGSAAGGIKPTTGYAFQRMWLHNKSLLNRSGSKLNKNNRFKFYDQLLLSIISQAPATAVTIFEELFHKVPIHKILRFLDEDTTLADEIKIFSKLPINPFLRECYNTIWKKQGEILLSSAHS